MSYWNLMSTDRGNAVLFLAVAMVLVVAARVCQVRAAKYEARGRGGRAHGNNFLGFVFAAGAFCTMWQFALAFKHLFEG